MEKRELKVLGIMHGTEGERAYEAVEKLCGLEENVQKLRSAKAAALYLQGETTMIDMQMAVGCMDEYVGYDCDVTLEALSDEHLAEGEFYLTVVVEIDA